MSERTARIRLMLNAGALLGGLTQVGAEVDKVGQKMATALSKPTHVAFGAMGQSVRNAANEAKTAAGFAIGLTGAISLGDSAKEALSLESGYKNMAFAIKAGTGEAVKWEELQKRGTAVGQQWKQSNGDVQASMRAIFEETGSLQFTKDAIGSVAKASLATGESMGTFGALASTAFEKFGVGADQIDEVLASMYSFGERGGFSVDELVAKMDMFGASAKAAGKTGTAGLYEIIGMARFGEKALGGLRQSVYGLTQLTDELGDPAKMAQIQKTFAKEGKSISLVDKSGKVKSEAIETLLVKTGGDATKMTSLFSGGGGKIMAEFARIYKEGADAKQGTAKEKAEAGLARYHEALKAASTANLEAAEMEQQATKKGESAKAQMTLALNELQNAFGSKEMIGAMKTLAAVTPKVAGGMAKLVSLAVEHPALAAAGYVGGRMGMAGLGSLAGSLTSTVTGALKKGIEVAYSPALSRSKIIKQDVFDSMGMKTGTKTIEVGTSKLRKAGELLGQATGIAIVAFAAYELGKSIIDAVMEANEAPKKKAEQDTAIALATSGTGDKAKMREQLDAMRKLRDEQDKEAKNGPGYVDQIGGGLTAAGNMLGLVSDDDYRSVTDRQYNDRKATNESIASLESALGITAEGGDKAAQALGYVAAAAEKLAFRMDKIGAPGTSHGIPPPGTKTPGHQ